MLVDIIDTRNLNLNSFILILVCENKILIDYWASKLSSSGYDHMIVSDWHLGSRANPEKVRVFVIDSSSFAFAKATVIDIRTSSDSYFPIILITSPLDQIKELIDLGLDYYLTKPVVWEELVSVVKSAVRMGAIDYSWRSSWINSITKEKSEVDTRDLELIEELLSYISLSLKNPVHLVGLMSELCRDLYGKISESNISAHAKSQISKAIAHSEVLCSYSEELKNLVVVLGELIAASKNMNQEKIDIQEILDFNMRSIRQIVRSKSVGDMISMDWAGPGEKLLVPKNLFELLTKYWVQLFVSSAISKLNNGHEQQLTIDCIVQEQEQLKMKIVANFPMYDQERDDSNIFRSIAAGFFLRYFRSALSKFSGSIVISDDKAELMISISHYEKE